MPNVGRSRFQPLRPSRYPRAPNHRVANRPMYREGVQWREFVNDVNSIQSTPYLDKMKDRNARSYPGDVRGSRVGY